MNNKYILNHAIHGGTITSRDIGNPEEYNTYNEAYQAYLDHRKFYSKMGYMIWYAEITNPDGSKKHLESNSYR